MQGGSESPDMHAAGISRCQCAQVSCVDMQTCMVGLEGCGGLCLHPEHGANLGPVRGCSEGCGVVATAQRLEPHTARSVEEGNQDMCASCQGTCGGLRKVAECNKKAG